MPKEEAEETAAASEKFFELPLEDRSLVLKVTDALHRKRFGSRKKKGGGAVLVLLHTAVSHDFIVSGVMVFWRSLDYGPYI